MPGNWVVPTTADLRTNVLDQLRLRDVDAVTHFSAADGTNMPTGALKFMRADGIWREWSGAVWVDKPIGIQGGGTGANTAALARVALGLTAIVTQDPVNVTLSGTFVLKGNVLPDADGTRNIGSNALRPNQIWVRNALVIPVGANKYAT